VRATEFEGAVAAAETPLFKSKRVRYFMRLDMMAILTMRNRGRLSRGRRCGSADKAERGSAALKKHNSALNDRAAEVRECAAESGDILRCERGGYKVRATHGDKGKNLRGERRLVQMAREEDMPQVYLKRLQNTQNGVPPTPIGVDATGRTNHQMDSALILLPAALLIERLGPIPTVRDLLPAGPTGGRVKSPAGRFISGLIRGNPSNSALGTTRST
jgi:hypothetical protein